MSFVDGVIQDIQRALGKVSGFYSLRISYWGSHLSEGLLLNYDFHEFCDSFLDNVESHRQPANIFLVVGGLNFVQLQALKEKYDSLSGRKFFIHVRGPIPEEKLKKSYMSSLELKDYFSIDIEYNVFPIDVKDLLQQILTLTKENRG